MAPTILITRPEPAGPAFADQVRAKLGCTVPIVLSPMMRIEVTGPLPDLAGVRTLIFTSRNAVDAYAALGGQRDLVCYAVGDATAVKAKSIGMVARSCQGNADALVEKLKTDRVAGRCLHLRGEHVTGDVAERLNSVGIEADEAIIYRQEAMEPSNAAKALLDRESPVILPLFSPRSARLFFDGPRPRAPLFVAAISDKVADCVPAGAVQGLKVAVRPNAQAVLNLLPELLDAGKQLEGGKRAQ